MAVWSRWLESVTRRVGFRALKKTLEAPYTTKVNNRVHTSRGATLDVVLTRVKNVSCFGPVYNLPMTDQW